MGICNIKTSSLGNHHVFLMKNVLHEINEHAKAQPSVLQFVFPFRALPFSFWVWEMRSRTSPNPLATLEFGRKKNGLASPALPLLLPSQTGFHFGGGGITPSSNPPQNWGLERKKDFRPASSQKSDHFPSKRRLRETTKVKVTSQHWQHVLKRVPNKGCEHFDTKDRFETP